MIRLFCDQCGDSIERNIKPSEMTKFKRHFCDKKCYNAYLRSIGHFKVMSLAGRAGRQRVMPVSNKEKPRRRRRAM